MIIYLGFPLNYPAQEGQVLEQECHDLINVEAR